MPEHQQSDEILWVAIQNSDYRAFYILFNRYWKKIYQTVFHYVNDKEIAERVVQDVFVVLWERREHLNIEKFASYIHVTARYHVFNELKAKKKSKIEYVEDYQLLNNASTSNMGELKLSYVDFENQIGNYLAPLPKRCKEIFWLSRIKNLSNDEIAEKFGISKRSVENQITIAQKYIRTSKFDIASATFTLLMLTSVIQQL